MCLQRLHPLPFSFMVTRVAIYLFGDETDTKGPMPDTAQQPTSSSDAKKGNERSIVSFPRAQRRPLHNLPLELSSFVGRTQEIAEVKRLCC